MIDIYLDSTTLQDILEKPGGVHLLKFTTATGDTVALAVDNSELLNIQGKAQRRCEALGLLKERSRA